MCENIQLISLCYLLFLNVSFINTKSQLFTLKNNKIIRFSNIEFPNIEDDVFFIISSSAGDEKRGHVWIKDGDNYEHLLDGVSE